MAKRKILLVLASAALLAGCFSKTKNTSVVDDNNYDTDPVSEITEDTSDNDFDKKTMPIEQIAVPSTFDSFTDETISAAGNYYLKGDYSKISITASKGTEMTIFLDGVNISCNTGVAFGSSKQIKLHLVILNNSVNTIENNYLDSNAFHIKGEVYISGQGTLTTISHQKSGLKVSKDLYIYEGITINSTGYDHAVSARSLMTNGVTFNLTTENKDGIHTECDDDMQTFTDEQGFAHLVNTAVTVDSNGDGIQSDTYTYISGGTYNIVTHGVFISYSTENMATYKLTKDDFKYRQSGDTYVRVAKDEIRSLNSSYYALKNSVKGIKSGAIEYDSNGDDEEDTTVTTGDYQTYIAHLAKLNINSTDDSIHTNYGKTTIDSANLTLETFDDGIHADYDLLVNNVSINISKCYEGLEGANVTVKGEGTNIVAVSQDDGINAASDLTTEHNIYIEDGYVRVLASGDGLDANTGLYLNGGTVIVEGPGKGNGSLDANHVYFYGGIVFACSTSGMTEKMTATQYTFAWQGSTISSGTKVSIVNSDNKSLFSYSLKQSCNQIFFSHPDMASGETYQILSGDTSLVSIKLTSLLTTSGVSIGGGPGGGPGGGGDHF